MAENERPKFADLFGDTSGVPKALKASTDALDEALGSFDALSGPLDALRKQVDLNIQSMVKQAKKGKISGKAATAQVKGQLKLLSELNATIEDEIENRVVGAKEIASMGDKVKAASEEVERYTEANAAGAKVLEERVGVEEALITAEKEHLTQLEKNKERDEKRLAQVEKVNERLEQFGDTLASGSVDVDSMRKSMTASTLDMLKTRAKEGRRGGKAGLVAGGAIAASAAVLFAGVERERKALEISAQRIFQYGVGTGGRPPTPESLEKEGVIVQNSLNRVRDAARAYGQEVEQMMTLHGELAGQTGQTWGQSADAITMVAGLASMGMGDVGDLTKRVTEMVNSLNISAPEAAERLQDVALEAVALNNELGAKLGATVQMDDFFSATARLADGIDGLAVSHKGLAKSMSFALKLGDKLIPAYNRRIKAAESLTRAMTQSYDEGFATMHVQGELAALLESKEYGKDAADIQRMLSQNMIHAGQAAKMLKDLGATSDISVISLRMGRAADALVEGNAAIVEAEVGDIGLDELKLLEAYGKARKEGKTMQDFLVTASKEDRETMLGMQKTIADRRKVSAKNLMDATIDDLMTSLAPVFQKALTEIVDLLKNLNMAINDIKDLFPGGKKEEKERERKLKAAQTIATGRETLTGRISALTGVEVTKTADAAMLLMSNKNLQAQYAKAFKGKEGGMFPKEIQKALVHALGEGDPLGKGTERTGMLVKTVGAARLGAMSPSGKQTFTLPVMIVNAGQNEKDAAGRAIENKKAGARINK